MSLSIEKVIKMRIAAACEASPIAVFYHDYIDCGDMLNAVPANTALSKYLMNNSNSFVGVFTKADEKTEVSAALSVAFAEQQNITGTLKFVSKRGSSLGAPFSESCDKNLNRAWKECGISNEDMLDLKTLVESKWSAQKAVETLNIIMKTCNTEIRNTARDAVNYLKANYKVGEKI